MDDVPPIRELRRQFDEELSYQDSRAAAMSAVSGDQTQPVVIWARRGRSEL